jgi:[NiFe] hydrogenase diaphorase moiety small subunit
MAYRFGITAPRFPYLWQKHDIDASHPDIMIDHNRCILCARCVRTSRDIDGKNVFGFVNRGDRKQIAANSSANLRGTDASAQDEAVDACPVGALLKKRVGYAVPVGKRLYDHEPIGTDIEKKQS